LPNLPFRNARRELSESTRWNKRNLADSDTAATRNDNLRNDQPAYRSRVLVARCNWGDEKKGSSCPVLPARNETGELLRENPGSDFPPNVSGNPSCAATCDYDNGDYNNVLTIDASGAEPRCSLSLSLSLLVEIGLGVIRTDRLAPDDVLALFVATRRKSTRPRTRSRSLEPNRLAVATRGRFKETERPRTLRNPLLGYHAETRTNFGIRE